MKICYLADLRSPHTKRWVDYFIKEHEIDLITLKYQGVSNMFFSRKDYEAIGVQVHEITKRELLLSPLTIRGLLKKITPDIIHAHFVTHYGFLGAISGFHPFVVSPWGSDIGRDVEQSKVFKFTVKYALRKADIVQCMDESFRQRVINLIGDSNSIKVIKEGINLSLFYPKKKKTQKVEKVLCLRKSQPPYNVAVLLHAIPKIVKWCPDVKFLLLNSGVELNETKNLINKLGIKNNVFFVGVMRNETVPVILNDADIYVDTFYQRKRGAGIGKTALEAMSCELPVVLSNTAGVGLHIEHKHNGYIYNGNDSNSLADGIIELIDNSRLRTRIGKKAREYVVTQQDFEWNMKIMEEYYKELIK